MATESELQTRKNEYWLRVPKVPRQSVDIFARDTEKGDYGLSAEVVDTIFEYAHLQQTLNSFDDLTFSADFLAQLPDDFRKKLDQNLYPGIPLANLEIPTTDKVLLAELLSADALTDVLSKSPVEVWVTPGIQKKLAAFNCTVETGLQQMDYGQLPLEAKHFLIGVMEYQEMQVHTILLAHERFPDGVPAVSGFSALFSQGEDEQRKITFDSLEDLDAQYESAQDAIDNPLQLFVGQMIQQMRAEKAQRVDTQVTEPTLDLDMEEERPTRTRKKRAIDIEVEAQTQWWIWKEYREGHNDIEKAVSDYLRAKYANKTIYSIVGAELDEAKQEMLSAFWRKRGRKHIDLGDEGWIENNLYLKPDGSLELHVRDDMYGNSDHSIAPGPLEHYHWVAVVDQAVKWIHEESDAMQAVREKWAKNGLDETQLMECTFIRTIDRALSDSARGEIGQLPQWFLDALNQESRFYGKLPLEYVREPSIDDLFSLSLQEEPRPRNMLKAYFIRSQHDLTRYGTLLTTPEKLYKVLGLDSAATVDQVKAAYRQIAKETSAIHISSPDEFDEDTWVSMNERFTEATKAYKALTKHRNSDNARITTLGKLKIYFENEE